MKTDRREFLKHVGIGGIGTVLLAGTQEYAHAAEGGKYGVLVDARKCVDCKACQIACKVWNGNEPDPDTYKTAFTASTWCYVQEEEIGRFPEVIYYTMERRCMHCEDPQCVTVCPMEGEAIHKESDGIVLINHENCIRCEACTEGCPYGGVPRLDKEAELMKKCTFCVDRVRQGMAPACVGTCPTEALHFASIEEIKTLAREAKKQGYPVYGLEREWPTSWIYVFPEGVNLKVIETQLRQEASRMTPPMMKAA
jgi:Fe-S-cluster-containing dehydrogenase component